MGKAIATSSRTRRGGRIAKATTADDRFAKVFAALGEPTRLRIMQILPREPICEQMYNVIEIADELGLTQPTISHHLKILRDTRFVRSERRGTFMYYRVNRNCLGEFPNAARLIMDV